MLGNKSVLLEKVSKTASATNHLEITEMIESYDFGRITVDGRKYTRDLIIFLNRVKDGWWRREGHKLSMHDLKEAVEAKPEVLIIGTGYNGYMDVSSDVREFFASKKIELIIEKTTQACKTYNRLAKSKRRVVAAFHLTC